MNIKKIIRPIKRKTFDIFVLNFISLVLRTRKKRFEQNFSIQSKNKSILFNTQYYWYHSWIDYTLAAALKYRGYDVKMLICDGLSYCEQETVTESRPTCATCYKNTKRRADLFGISTVKIGELITKEKVQNFSKISKNDSIQSLKIYKYLNVDIGKFAINNTAHFYKGVFEIEGEKAEKFRKIIESALIICEATNNFFKVNNFDKVVTPNGKFIQSGISVQLSELYKINFYTWDLFLQQSASIFSKNNIAHDQKIDDLWGEIGLQDLSELKIKKVSDFYNLQSKSLNTPFKYYDSNIVENFLDIKKELSLNSDSKLITLFTNVEWDSTAMGQNLAYIDMFDWVTSVIDFVISEKNIDLIVRAHPGESKVPSELKSRSVICERILGKYKKLPNHIKLIDSNSNLSSYSLAKISNISMVYTSTLGLEFALMGIKPWIAATPYYSGKGFSVDVKSHDEFVKLVQSENINSTLDKKAIDFAIKLAYVVKFRRLISYPVFNSDGKFQLFDYQTLFNPDADNTIQNVCDFIEDKRNYLDLGQSINS
jgi:hypothetical protein